MSPYFPSSKHQAENDRLCPFGERKMGEKTSKGGEKKQK